MAKRAAIIVLDGVGIGEAPDAAAYGDTGSDTLGHVVGQMAPCQLENLREIGLGNIRHINGLPAIDEPAGAFGMMSPSAAGKDSTTGHWEIAGVQHRACRFRRTRTAFRNMVTAEFTAPHWAPVIGNVAGSGTDIIAQFGAEHSHGCLDRLHLRRLGFPDRCA